MIVTESPDVQLEQLQTCPRTGAARRSHDSADCLPVCSRCLAPVSSPSSRLFGAELLGNTGMMPIVAQPLAERDGRRGSVVTLSYTCHHLHKHFSSPTRVFHGTAFLKWEYMIPSLARFDTTSPWSGGAPSPLPPRQAAVHTPSSTQSPPTRKIYPLHFLMPQSATQLRRASNSHRLEPLDTSGGL